MIDLVEEVEFYKLEKEIYKLVCSLGCEIIKLILENQDKQLMETRDKKEYRHKGYRKNTIKTIMGEIEYDRAIYYKDNKYTYLLDSELNIDTIGKFSSNLVDLMLSTVVNTTSYRKAAKEIQNLSNETISHQALNQIVWKIGEKIENKENEEIKLYKKGKLIQGTKETKVLFEEADGIWFNLQGKDRQEAIEKYKKECEKKKQEFNPNHKHKTELKLHITYEGWSKNNNRYSLVNKAYITGMMTPDRLKKLRNARVYQKYNEKSIEFRALNGDGAKWINNIATNDTICQKDSFHIQQEIIRDIREKEHREELIKMIEEKRYNEVQQYVENLKYEFGVEEKTVKKLNTLQSYLKNGLPRYQDILKEQGREMPKAPKNIEYRSMGTMESQIFTVLKVRLCSGRKSFLKKGASYLSKVCAIYCENNGEIELEKIENEIKIDNSVEEYINEIEENVKRNKKMHRANRILTNENNYLQGTIVEKIPQIKEITRLLEPTTLIYR